jgi:predicted RNA-binding Zn-ribbon protein involved in translation (DUF1610 family)
MFLESENLMKATEILNRCPNCGGTIQLDESSGMLVCGYCKNSYTHEQLKGVSQGESLDHHEYTCNGCGAVMVVDENTLTSCCAYCGNTSIIKNRVSGKYHPDYIIPFSISPDEAKRNFLGVLKYRNYIKKRFRKGFEVEDVASLFVPFWLYDCSAKGSCTYKLPNGSTQSIDYSESYARVPVDASVRIDDNYMDVIEPFNYADLKPFDKVYLIGHMAERYDTDVRIMSKRAKSKVKKAVKTSISRHIAEDKTSIANATFSSGVQLTQTFTNALVDRAKTKFDNELTSNNVNFSVDRELILNETCISSIKSIKTKIDFTRHQYALFPIYLLRGKYKGKSYLYAINGQNGKVSGKFPFSKFSYFGINVIGEAFGALMFATVVSIALHMVLSSLELSLIKSFGIVYTLSFLMVHILESTTNAKSNTSHSEQLLGTKPIVANATHYRVAKSFKTIRKNFHAS